MSVESREGLLIQVATLYYEQDLNQEEIARCLKLSRSNVSRLLKEAKGKGLVEIRVRKPIETVPVLERELRRRFNLHQAMVVANRGRSLEDSLAAAGQLAARYLEALLHPADMLAISWGTGVAAAVSALRPNRGLHIDVIQMIGSVGTVDPSIDGHELARLLAGKLGGRHYYLHAPLFVDSRAACQIILEQPTIADTMRRVKEATVALVGVGTTEVAASSFVRAGHLTESQIGELRAMGAVGETVGRHFDINGNALGFDINQRVIAVDLPDVKRIPHVVAVACGLLKRKSILGALRGGYVNVLATDEITAQAVIDEAKLNP